MNKKQEKRISGGFTLVEMIVAVGITSTVLLSGLGLLLTFNTIQRKSINAQNVHDNIRFAMETMSREMRTGDSFCAVSTPCTPNPTCAWPAGCTQFAFRQTFTNEAVVYKLDGNVVKVSRDGGVSFLPITDPQRAVTNLKFYITGVGIIDQERVTIVMEVNSGSAAHPDEAVNLVAQTTVAKRKLGD